MSEPRASINTRTPRKNRRVGSERGLGCPALITPKRVFVFMLGVEVRCWFVGVYFSGVGRSVVLGFVLGRGFVLVWRDRMREETAYIFFCGVLAPKFR